MRSEKSAEEMVKVTKYVVQKLYLTKTLPSQPCGSTKLCVPEGLLPVTFVILEYPIFVL